MTKNEFFTQSLLMIIGGLVASLTGAITAAWWSAPLMTLGLYLAFVAFNNRILLGKLYGKVGKSPLAWMGFHSLFQTITLAVLVFVFALLFQVHVAQWLFFSGLTAFAYLVLCQRDLRNFFGLLGMWIATRR